MKQYEKTPWPMQRILFSILVGWLVEWYGGEPDPFLFGIVTVFTLINSDIYVRQGLEQLGAQNGKGNTPGRE